MKKSLRIACCLMFLGSLAFASAPGQELFPERITYQGLAVTAEGEALEGEYPMTFRYFDRAGNTLLALESVSSVKVGGGCFEVELGSEHLVSPEEDGATTSLCDIAAAHPVFQLEVAIDGVTQSPMVEVRPAGHSLKSHLVLSGSASADDEGPHWKHYEHRGAVSAVESVRLRPSSAKGDGSSKRGPMLVPMSGPMISLPVRDLPVAEQVAVPDEAIPVNPMRHETLYDKDGRRFGTGLPQVDDALAERSRASFDRERETPAPSLSFEGINNRNGVLPPDTEGAVGPNHYVQVVNLSFAIFDKSGTLTNGPFNTNTLWTGFGGACENDNSGDAIFLYDQFADRWVFSQFAVTTGNDVCFAVSTSPDPTGTFYLYRMPAVRFPDYYKLGIWPDPTHNAYLMGTNTGFAGQYDVYAVDRANLLAGTTPRSAQYFVNFPNLLMPADVDGPIAPPAGSPGLFYTFRDGGEPYFIPSSPVDSLDIYEMSIDWATPANSTLSLVQQITPPELADFIWTICGFFVTDCLPQPGTSQGLDSLSWWPMQRLAYRNYETHESMAGSWTVDTLASGDRAAPRWFELRRTGGAWGMYQQGTYAPDSANRWGPSIAMDAIGGIALGYSVVDAPNTVYPSIRYATRSPGDTLGTLQAEQSLIAGSGAQTSSFARWGDYSSMEIDPSDDCTFWYTTEYIQTTGSANWQTRVGTFSLPECSAGETFLLSTDPTSRQICFGDDVEFEVTATAIGDYSEEVTFDLSGVGGGFTFDPNPVTPTASSDLTISGLSIGTHSLEVQASGDDPNDPPNTIDRTADIEVEVLDDLASSPVLSQPANGATGVNIRPMFQWGEVTGAVDYLIEIATDAGFNTIVDSATVETTSYTPTTALAGNMAYWWRVTAENPCGTSASGAFTFTTVNLTCSTYPSTDTPLPIPPSGTSGTTTSTISVGAVGSILDVNVTLQGTHTWIGDLEFELTSPGATTISIMDTESCGDTENFDLTLDDDATSSYPCPPTGGGTYLPDNPLATYNGEGLNGAWVLTITDNFTGDVGSLDSWSLEVCTAPPPNVDVDPTSLDAALLPDTATDETIEISNVGGSALTWTMDEENERPVPLPNGAVNLTLDDGSAENAIGAGGQFLWLNRFTPPAAYYPITLTGVGILFRSDGSVSVGETVDIYVWEDTDEDGDPGTGATHRASLNGAQVQFVDDSTFSQYTLGSPVVLNGPGDILIGVVNRSAGADAGEFPAALDQTTSSGRSWAGVYNAGNPGNPPTLPADNIWGTIDSLNYPGNWLVRGVGTTDAACSSASDIPWLSVTPTSGTIFPAGSDNVTVTFDSAGLSEGSYSGHLCLTCNDPLEPLVAVPVSLTVNLPLIFVDGFEEGDMEAWSDTVQ